MAAPKTWGYTRGREIPDEILVSWADGDLTAQVAQEVDETLLMDRAQRREVAAYARAGADSIGEEITTWHGKRPGERAIHVVRPRPGLVDTLVEEYSHHPGDWETGKPEPRQRSSAGLGGRRIAGILFALAVAAAVIAWMVKNL